MQKTIQLSKPCLGEEEWQAMREPIMSGWLTQGPKVAEFEQAFAAQVGAKYAVALTSCTTALHLSMLAAGIGPGDEVIVPSFSWVATANAVEYCGATPVFIDIEKDSYNIDPTLICDKITPKTKAIVPVHLFGRPANMDAVKRAAGPDIIILEDAACAAGAKYRGQHAGTFGQSASFSFHPRKSITTGEGGMITTDDPDVYEKICVWRNHGLSATESMKQNGAQPHDMGEVNVLGYNYRMTDLQAAVGIVQLQKMYGWIAERDSKAAYYAEQLADLDWLICPRMDDDYQSSWQAYVAYIDEGKSPMSRNDIMLYLKERGIATRPGTQAIHMLGYYKTKYGLKDEDFPNARDCFYHTMAIPMHNEMTDDDYDTVIQTLREIR